MVVTLMTVSPLPVCCNTRANIIFKEKSFECMKAAYDVGVNFFDCAEAYSNGESEIVMGKAIRHFKSESNPNSN